jgi:hypothetical protein
MQCGTAYRFRHHIRGKAVSLQIHYRQTDTVDSNAVPDFNSRQNLWSPDRQPAGHAVFRQPFYGTKFRNQTCKHGKTFLKLHIKNNVNSQNIILYPETKPCR